MAILFLFGAMSCFVLAQRDSFQTQDQDYRGAPIGPARTVQLTKTDKVGFNAFGIACAIGFFWFVVRVRRDDVRK
jgi:hypothetical protein